MITMSKRMIVVCFCMLCAYMLRGENPWCDLTYSISVKNKLLLALIFIKSIASWAFSSLCESNKEMLRICCHFVKKVCVVYWLARFCLVAGLKANNDSIRKEEL